MWGPGEVPHACDISTWEAEVGVQGLSGLMRACQEREKRGWGRNRKEEREGVCGAYSKISHPECECVYVCVGA